MNTIARAILCCSLVFGVSACASPAGDRAQLAREALVGMPRSQLLRCAGQPQRTREDGSTLFLTYETGSDPTVASPTTGVFGGTQDVDSSFDVPLSTRLQSDFCTATFTLVDDRVTRVAYSSKRGGRHAECAPIVENCLRQVGRE